MSAGDSPQDYYAEEGDWPPSRIVPFVKFVMRDAKKTFEGLRVTRTLRGVSVVADYPTQDFTGAWTVSLSGPKSVRIGAGTVNGLVPWLDGRDLEGLDEKGNAHSGGVPLLSLDDGPGTRRRSYIGILVRVVSETGKIDVDDRESITVDHRPSLHAAFSEGGAPDEESTGFWPLAQATWSADGDRVERLRQWAYFHYVHRFQRGDGGKPGRHWFRPA